MGDVDNGENSEKRQEGDVDKKEDVKGCGEHKYFSIKYLRGRGVCHPAFLERSETFISGYIPEHAFWQKDSETSSE